MSPIATMPAIASPLPEAARSVLTGTAVCTPDNQTAACEQASSQPEASAATTTSAATTPEEDTSQKTADTRLSYSARTSFDAATGEWALVIERHPPETGVTVAEQKGFLSQYSALVTSPVNLRAAFSMRI